MPKGQVKKQIAGAKDQIKKEVKKQIEKKVEEQKQKVKAEVVETLLEVTHAQEAIDEVADRVGVDNEKLKIKDIVKAEDMCGDKKKMKQKIKERVKDKAIEIAEDKLQEAIDHVAEEIGVDGQIVPKVDGVLQSARKEARNIDIKNTSLKEIGSAAKEKMSDVKGCLNDAASAAAEEIKANKEQIKDAAGAATEEMKEKLEDAAVEMIETKAQEAIDEIADSIGVDKEKIQIDGALQSLK